jgi:hypothetical protein
LKRWVGLLLYLVLFINDVFTLGVGEQVDKNEKEIEALKYLKAPKLNAARKDISSPIRSSMSQHLGSNLHKRRSDSQSDLQRTENIQKLAEQDLFLKTESRNVPERESVLSHSRINKYLGESFEEPSDINYNTNVDRVTAYRESARKLSQEKDQKDKFQRLNKNMLRSSPGEEVIVEDIDSGYEEESDRKRHLGSQQKPVSSKQSECTFKADEIFNDRSEQESQKASMKKQPLDPRNVSLQKKLEESKGSNLKDLRKIDLSDQKKNILLQQNQPLSAPSSNLKDSSPPYKVQLGPIGGDTLDEESSEEGYESELSLQDNEYFQGHIAQKHQQVSKAKSKSHKELSFI